MRFLLEMSVNRQLFYFVIKLLEHTNFIMSFIIHFALHHICPSIF